MGHRGRLLVRLVAAIWLVAAFSAVSTARAGGGPIFINEIHYDNDGTDTGEGIEIAGPAGTDLSGWSLVLYNGANGLVYDTISLSGTLADQEGGIGTLWFAREGIQNGSPDGIALVDNVGSVIQFLSYEGSLTALDGPANTLTSEDIGVAEDGSTPAGQSLSLQGNGTTYGEFTWGGITLNRVPATPGQPNAGQAFAPPLAVLVGGFEAFDAGEQVLLQWETLSEIGNVGFNLYRATADNAPGAPINGTLIPSAAPGAGQGAAYEYLDSDVQVGQSYFYWLESVAENGQAEVYGPAMVLLEAPTAIQVSAFDASQRAMTDWLYAAMVAGALFALGAVRLRRPR